MQYMKIHEFKDYREFIRFAIQRMRSQDRRFSLGYIARRTGCSESFLKKLQTKKTHLGIKYTSKLFAALKLSEFERRYLRFWLLKELSEDRESKSDLHYNHVHLGPPP